MYFQQQIDFAPEEVIDYLRKSRSDDPNLTVEEVLEKHEADLDEWDDRNLSGRVPKQNRFYEVVSGETLKERPEINKVLRLIESPKYRAVKVYDLQRLSRGDLEDVGRLLKLFKLTGTYIITTRQERIFNLRDEFDFEAVERDLKAGNYYLNYAKKVMAAGRLQSVARGNYIGSVAPYGFNRVTVMDGKKKCPTLEENPEQADVVRMIFDMYVNQDMGRPSICYRLDELGIKPPKGKKWSPAAMKDLLENIHYIGKVKWNWRKTVTIVEDSEIIQTRPKARIGEYLIYEGRHDGIISEELFNAAQEKTGRNPKVKSKAKIRNPLAGLLYCKCGRAISLRTYKNPDGTERSPARLLCDGQKYCNSGSVLYDEMIDRVCSILEQCIEDFEIRLQNDTGDSAKLHAKLIKNLERKLEELQAKELAQWEAQADPDEDKRMPHHIFKQLNEKLLKEKDEVQQALCKAQKSMPDPVDYEDKVKRFRDALEALKDPTADVQKQNRLLKACIDRIEYSREKPQRIPSQQVRYYDKEQKRTRWKSPLNTGGNWTSPPIELDVKLKV